MLTRILSVSPDDPREDRLEAGARVLRDGGVVAVPTETFYGLAVDPFEPQAVRRLLALKGKPERSPILLLLAGAWQVEDVVAGLPEAFVPLAERFWPGPLTIVVRAAAGLPDEVTGGTGTVGIRVPGLALPRELARALARPVTGTSANAHGAPACRTAADVLRGLPAGIDLVLDGGTTAGAAPSTVLDLSGEAPRIVRHGAVTVSSLLPFLPGLDAAPL
jgi:tRNA threonylcarbamoyl adenosine modification protein (Sua5/YciO/YrdC/YwlC family)